MKHLIRLALLPMALMALSAQANDSAPHWAYEGAGAPEHWAELSPEFSLCAKGQNQSPINIKGALKGSLKPLQLKFVPTRQTIVNNGHTIQVNVASGDVLTLDGGRFELQQFHFHTPSENQINGKSFPLEAHFVYKDAQGELAVLALMLKDGAANPQLAHAWQTLPKEVGGSAELSDPVNIRALLPKNLAYYRFSGSLTTPPCSEGVRWLVLKESVSASKTQVEQFAARVHHHNNRPVQPAHGRVVIQ